MEYYNHRGELVEYNRFDKKYTLHGGSAMVYVFDGFMIKRYFAHTKPKYHLQYDIYKIIDSFNNPHIMKISELLLEKDRYDQNKSAEENFSLQTINEYIATFYKPSKNKIIDLDKNFLLEMQKELIELVTKMSYEKIRTSDIKPENTVVQDNNIILIDWDGFKKSDEETEIILNRNIRDIAFLIKWLCSNSCQDYCEKDVIKDLFNFVTLTVDKVCVEDPTQELSKRLSNHKTVREYINSKVH